MLSISFNPGEVYDYTNEHAAVVAPGLGDNYGVFIADLTGEGNNEIIAAQKNSILSFLNQGGTSAPFADSPHVFSPNSMYGFEGMVVGNFNHERTPDTVTVHSHSNDLHFYFWDGRYLTSGQQPSESISSSVDLVELLGIQEVENAFFTIKLTDLQVIGNNADGKNDIVCTFSYLYTTNAESIIVKGDASFIFEGQGDGTFSNPVLIKGLPETGSILGTGRLTGSSAVDIIVQNTDNTIAIYTLSADGKTVSNNPITYTHGSKILGVHVGDVNGNGQQELLIYSKNSSQNHLLDIVKLDGRTPSKIDSIELSTNPVYVAVGDLDNDTKPDILLSNGTSYQVLIQNSNGKFASQDQIVTVAGYMTTVVGDFDGDGIPDVLALGKRVATLIPGDTSISPYVIDALNFSEMDFTPRDFAVGDFDGNGTLDLAVLSDGYGTEVRIFSGTPNGTSLFVKSQEISITFGQKLLVGQFDTGHAGDDLAVVHTATDLMNTSNIVVFKSTDLGLSQSEKVTSTLNAGYLGHFAVGKLFNEDRDDIVAIKESTDQVYIFSCNGAGKFSVASDVLMANSSVPNAVSIGDMNKDGKNDIVVLLAGQKSVQILKQESNNQFTKQDPILISQNIQSTSSCRTMQVADFDGDGFLDIFVGVVDGVGTHSGSFFVLKNNPDNPGTITERISTEIPEFAANNYAQLNLSIGLVDNNASPDVIIVHDNRIVTYKNRLEFTLENGEITLVFRDYNSTKTTTELADLSTLDKQKTFLDEWSCFQLEVWANTKSTKGVSEFSCTIQFDNTIFEVDSIDLNQIDFIAEAGSAFENFTCVVNGNQVTISGTWINSSETQGDNANTLLGRIAFIPVARDVGGLPVTKDGSYLKAYENGFSLVTGNDTWLKTGSAKGNPVGTIHNDVALFPVVFDVDDSGEISISDYTYFTNALLVKTYNNAPDHIKLYYNLMDLDFESGVTISDWSIFVRNLLARISLEKCREEKMAVSYPSSFPPAWLTENKMALPSSVQPAPVPASLPETLNDDVETLLAVNHTTADKQDLALVNYLNGLTSKRTETSFFDELAANQNDTDTLLKIGAL